MEKININKTTDIEAIRQTRQNELYQINKANSPTVESKPKVSEDKLELSENASKVGKLVEEVKSFPDVRTDKVDELRSQIASGNYNPTGEQIADAIFKDEGKI